MDYDIDFYYYYCKNQEEKNEFDIMINKQYNDDYDIIATPNVEFPSSPIKLEVKMNNRNEQNEREKMTTRLSSKMAFKFGKLLDFESRKTLTIESRLFDEVDWIEEEFNNIYVRFMRFLLEKFNNLMNNSSNENIFLCVNTTLFNPKEFDTDYYFYSVDRG